VPGKRGEIQDRIPFFENREVLGKGTPSLGDVLFLEVFLPPLSCLTLKRSRRKPAVAVYLGCDTLKKLALRPGVGKKCKFGMPVDVYEPRTYCEPTYVENLFGIHRAFADIDDFVAQNAYVSNIR
jgi:hypothetical protein